MAHHQEFTAIAPILIVYWLYKACPNKKVQLKNTKHEAECAQQAYGGEPYAEVKSDLSLRGLDALLAGRMVLHLACHNDAPLGGQLVPAFVNEAGELEMVSIEAVSLCIRCKSYRSRLVPRSCPHSCHS